MLDDPEDVARPLLAQDAAVAGRVLDLGGEDRDRVRVGRVRGQQLSERRGVQQRDVARHDDDGALGDRTGGVRSPVGGGRLRGGVQRRHGDLDGAPGARDVVLVGEHHLGVHVLRVRDDLLAPVPHDDDHATRLEAAGGAQRVAEEGAAAEPVQDLRCGRAHPGSFTCGEDDDGGGTGERHLVVLLAVCPGSPGGGSCARVTLPP